MMYHSLTQKCTCFHVYKLYVDLPIVVHKRDPVFRDSKRESQTQSDTCLWPSQRVGTPVSCGECTPASGGARARP